MKLKELLNLIKPNHVTINCDVHDVELMAITDPLFNLNSFGWCSDKNFNLLHSISSGSIILSEKGNDYCKSNGLNSFNLIIVDKPRSSFNQILNKFYVIADTFPFISPSANISKSVKFNDEKVNIGHNTVIEDNVELGDKVVIGANTVVKSGTIIKKNVIIGSNCTIGGVGFGYEKNEEGNYEFIPHIGNVIIDDNVEIGNNVCVDRAVLGSTRISSNVKIDNLVHVAHGVSIGRNSLIIANAMIAGSTHIGENVWVAPSSSVKQKLIIADNSIIGMGGVVIKNVGENDVVAGVPAKKIN